MYLRKEFQQQYEEYEIENILPSGTDQISITLQENEEKNEEYNVFFRDAPVNAGYNVQSG